MGALEEDREILSRVFDEWVNWPGPEANFTIVPVTDYGHDRYLLLDMGWEHGRRIHGVLVHVDIINGKFWIQQDNTEQGFALDLVAAGVPKDRIVLAFKSEERRRITDYAVA